MTAFSGLTESQAARIAAVVIGLGPKPDDDCELCTMRGSACAVHVGEEIARWLFRDRDGTPSASLREAAEAVSNAYAATAHMDSPVIGHLAEAMGALRRALADQRTNN